MAVTKKEYNLWKAANPRFAILHKLHAEDVNQQFGGIPRAIKMSWEDYDKYIHLNDLCAYDLLLQVLGMGVMMGQLPFMLDRTRDWTIAIGNKTAVVHGELDHDGYYLLRLSKPTKRAKAGALKFAPAQERALRNRSATDSLARDLSVRMNPLRRGAGVRADLGSCRCC